MNESQRLACLDVMGVDVLVPRYILPGAMPSPQGDRLQAVQDEATSQDQDRSALLGSVLQELESDASMPVASVEKAAKPPKPVTAFDVDVAIQDKKPAAVRIEKTPAQRPQVPHFDLQIVHNGLGLGIVTSIAKGGLRKEHKDLLEALLFAFNRTAENNLRYEHFHWPLFKDRHAEQGEVVARQALAGFVQARVVQQGLNCVLVMGVDAARYLFDEFKRSEGQEGDIEKQWQALSSQPQTLAGLQQRVFFGPAIAELMNDPNLKKDFWLQLQPLLVNPVHSH